MISRLGICNNQAKKLHTADVAYSSLLIFSSMSSSTLSSRYPIGIHKANFTPESNAQTKPTIHA